MLLSCGISRLLQLAFFILLVPSGRPPALAFTVTTSFRRTPTNNVYSSLKFSESSDSIDRFTVSNPTPIRKRYGLYGDFDGDDILEQEIRSFESLTKAGKEESSFEKLTMLADCLPVKGRNELANVIASQNQQLVDTFVSKLLDYILKIPSDQKGSLVELDDINNTSVADKDFVSVASLPSNNANLEATQPNKELRIANRNHYTHGQVFLSLLSRASTEQQQSICNEYMHSASTQYRADIARQMVYISTVSDEDIIHLCNYETSKIQDVIVRSVTDTINGKYQVNRVHVLETLLRQGRYVKYKYMASSEYIRKELSEHPGMSLQNWNSHHQIYLSELRTRLEKCRTDTRIGIDRVRCGKVWNDFIGQIHGGESLKEECIDPFFQLLEEYIPCMIQSSVPYQVREHLEQVSMSGDKDILNYKNISQISLANLFMLFPKKIRKKQLLHAFQSRNWDRFDQLRHLVKVRNLDILASEVFTQATEEDLWNHILARSDSDKFFQFMADNLESSFTNYLSMSLEIIQLWHELHLRYPPHKTSSKVMGYLSSERAWKLWHHSYQRGVDKYIHQVQERFIKASQNERPLEQSQVTLYARALRFLMEETLRGVGAIEGHVSRSIWIDSVHKVLDGTYGKEKLSFEREQELNLPTRVKELARVWEDVTMKYVLSNLETLLHFDPRDHAYLDSSKIEQFASRLKKWIQLSTSDQVWGASFEVGKDCLLRAQEHISEPNNQHFLEVTDSDTGELTFVFYDAVLHEKAVDQCLDCMKELMSHKLVPIDLKRKVWELLQQNSKAASLDSDDQYFHYCCTFLPKEIQSLERKNLVSRARSLIIGMKNKNELHMNNARCLEPLWKCGNVVLLEEVLSGNIVPEELCQKMCISYGSFESKMVRDILRRSTEHQRDGDKRAQGYILWLQKAITASQKPDLLVEALEFITTRIQNENGLHKKPVFSQLSEIVSSFVIPTLVTGDKDAAKSMATFLVQILEKDLERRDSIAKHHMNFPLIASSILEQTLLFDPTKKQIAVRAIWIQCSIRISWILSKANGSAQEFQFPLNFRSKEYEYLPITKWIQETEFDKIFPHTDYPVRLKLMREDVHLPGVIKRFDASQAFGPKDAIELMVDALQNVWDKQITNSMPFEYGQYLSHESTSAMNILRRLEQLFMLSYIHFEDSPFLVKVFDQLYDTESMRAAPMEHFCLAEGLLIKMCSVCSPSGLYLSEHRRLAKAIDSIFQYCLQNNLHDKACYWLGYWKKIDIHRSRNNLHHVDNRLLRTLVKYDWLNFVEGYSDDHITDKTLITNRECSFAKNIISTSTSALSQPDVQNIVFQHRPDVLLHYHETNKTMDCIGLIYHSTSAIKVDNFPPTLAKLYASYAYRLSLDESLDIKTRTLAIERFTTCPITNNADVLSVLADQTLEPLFVEAITLRIFTLDSPWHILAHLLSAEVLHKRRQSTTASLLAHVEKHVPIYQTIQCLELLLAPSRRNVLGITLHKAILRMLFRTKTSKSKELLQSEWDNILHKDVRHEFIILCLQAVLTSQESVDWEWKILNNVASSKTSLSKETSLKLLSILVDRNYIEKVANDSESVRVEAVLQEESAIVTIRQKFAKSIEEKGSIAKRRKLYLLMEKLSQNISDPDLRNVALLQKWKLSSIFDNSINADDPDGTLDEIEKEILADTRKDCIFLIEEMSHIYGRGLRLCIMKAARSKSQGINWEIYLSDVSKDHPLARRASIFISNLISLDDRQSWIAMKIICNSRGGWGTEFLGNLDCFDENISESSKKIELLKEKEMDAQLVLSMTQVMRNNGLLK